MSKPEYWLRLKPWSVEALLVAVAALAAAVTMRVGLGELGVPLYLTTFVPAILATSLLAGVPAGVFTAISAVIIEWWAFMPPAFEFSPLTRGEVHTFTLFLLSTALLVWFGHLCRTAIRMRQRKTA